MENRRRGWDRPGCYDNPGKQLVPHDGAEWVKYQVRFDELTQLGFGLVSPLGDDFPKAAITHIKLDIGVPSEGPTPAWDLFVDDLTFF